jgi:hypothetical protein
MPLIARISKRFMTGLAVGRLLPAYLLLGLFKHFVPLTWLARLAWSPPAGRGDREAEERLAARLLRISRLIGVPDRDCLQRSLLLYRVLSRAGADPTLTVGFQQIDGRIQGHAWVAVDGRPLNESDANLARFTSALSFGVSGALVPRPEDRVAS